VLHKFTVPFQLLGILLTLMRIASLWPESIAFRRCANFGSSLKLTVSSADSPGLSLKLLGVIEYLSLLLALTSPSTEALVLLVTRTQRDCTCTQQGW
jgi:hypothetical protein